MRLGVVDGRVGRQAVIVVVDLLVGDLPLDVHGHPPLRLCRIAF
jgi:hypothetical protein